MKLTAKILGVLLALSLFGFVSCSDDDSESASASNTKTNAAAFTVGNTVSVDGIPYYVISNPFASFSTRSASRSAISEETESDSDISSAISAQRATEFAQKIFGDTVVLLRVSGKVTVPQGAKETYISAYNAVTAEIPEGLTEKDFFAYNSVSSDKNSYYRDTYLILSDAETLEKKGSFEAMYSSSTELTDGHTLDELLIDFSPEIIRKTVPNQYKIKDAAGTLIRQYYFTGEVMRKENEPIMHYKTSKGIKPSAFIENSWNAEGDGAWTKMEICLCSVYDAEATGPGLRYYIKKNSSNYKYHVRGSSDLTPQSSTAEVSFSFNDDGTYTDENIDASGLTFSESATLYEGREQAYNDAALSIPVDFILNEDGSVSPGPKIYEWITAWRDYIIEQNADASLVVD